MCSRLHDTVVQHLHFSSQQVVYGQLDNPLHIKRVLELCGGVERVGMILSQVELCGLQFRLIFNNPETVEWIIPQFAVPHPIMLVQIEPRTIRV